MRTIATTIRRYSAEKGAYSQEYTVPVDEHEVLSVMNVLEYIYTHLDDTLAFFSHAACKAAAMPENALIKINGKPRLACKERADTDELLLEPAGKTVIRDLISK